MKGLLLKDWYMARKYCRAYVLLAAMFIAMSAFGNGNAFFLLYPCMLCGMLPVTLLAYDERSRWLQYSGTLPYSRAQIVSSKYLMGLMAQAAVLIATGIAQAVKMSREGGFRLDELAALLLIILLISAVTSSISLPFMFKLGVEKGRLAYYVMIAMTCAGGLGAASLLRGDLQPLLKTLPGLCLLGGGLYALSWYLSVVFFEKREI